MLHDSAGVLGDAPRRAPEARAGRRREGDPAEGNPGRTAGGRLLRGERQGRCREGPRGRAARGGHAARLGARRAAERRLGRPRAARSRARPAGDRDIEDAGEFLDAGERRALSLSGDGTTAAIASGNTVVLLDAKTLHPLRFFDGASSLAGASLSADGKLLAILQRDAVEVWSTATDKRVQRLVWAGEEPREALFTPDGKRLIVGAERSFDAVIRVWNLETGDSADSFSLPREGAVSCMALSRDGKQLAIGTDRGTLQLWAVSPHKQVASLAKKESYLESLLSLAFSPKGDKLLAFARTGKMTVWDTKTTKSLWDVDAEASFGHGAATFSSDGTRVRGSTEAGFHTAIREWDAATGAELQNKPAGIGPAFFSQDGRFGFGAIGISSASSTQCQGRRRPCPTRRRASGPCSSGRRERLS